MKNKITSGIWFVFIGLILLLHNMNLIDFNFWAMIKYWPLLIIIVGVNLIVQQKTYGNYIKIVSNILVLTGLTYIGLTDKSPNWMDYVHIRTQALSDTDSTYSSQINLPYDSLVQEASIKFNAGGGSLEMKADSADQLFSAESPDKSMGIHLEQHEKDGKKQFTLDIMPESKSKKSNHTLVQLHPNILWDLDLNYGAAYINCDFSTLRLRNLTVNSAASNINMHLDSPRSGVSKIDINTGASTIQLQIPKEAAMRIKYTSALSSTKLEGFEFEEEGMAKTADFDQAHNKYDLELNGAVNDIKISRY